MMSSYQILPFSDITRSMFSRKEWIEQTHFHALSDQEVLQRVSQKIQAFKGERRPLILLDLDSTLYEVAPRTLRIIQEWLVNSPEIPQALKESLEKLVPAQLGYSIQDTFTSLGFPLITQEIKKIATDLKAFWWDRFFTSSYLTHDHPYPGAVEYANHLYDLGANLCYLTARDETRMRQGTENNLRRDGFPFDSDGISLLMRTDSESTDSSHKANRASDIASQGFLIASFENEPVNLVTLANLLPHADHIFVDTVCSDAPAPAGKNLFRIKGFSSFSDFRTGLDSA